MCTGVVQGYRRTTGVHEKYRGRAVHAYNNISVQQGYPSSTVNWSRISTSLQEKYRGIGVQ
jgi:hypothetical protein